MDALVAAAAIAQFVITARPQPAGLARLVHSVPLLLVLFIAPTKVTFALTVRGGVAFILAWLSNAKVLAFAANRGPLAHAELSTAQFVLLLLAPVMTSKPSRAQQRMPWGALRILSTLAIQAVAHAAITFLVTSSLGLPTAVLHALYAAYIYLTVALLLDPALPLMEHVLLVDGKSGRAHPAVAHLQPCMRAPYLSASVQEFWGHRYNQVVSASLYHVVAAPILEGRWVRMAGQQQQQQQQQEASPANATAAAAAAGKGRPGQWRQAMALVATFVVSGVMHEFMIMYMCLGVPGTVGQQTLFFIAQPPIILAQRHLSAALAPWWQQLVVKSLPRQWQQRACSAAAHVLRITVSLGLLLLTAEFWFWGSFEKGGCSIDVKGLGEIRGLLDWLLAHVSLMMMPSV